jgi:hypothetical protein
MARRDPFRWPVAPSLLAPSAKVLADTAAAIVKFMAAAQAELIKPVQQSREACMGPGTHLHRTRRPPAWHGMGGWGIWAERRTPGLTRFPNFKKLPQGDIAMPKTDEPSVQDPAERSEVMPSDRRMTTTKAEKITTLITTELNTMGAAREAIEAAYEAALPLIKEAYARQAHKALGYDTWESYVHDRFDDLLLRLGVDLRRRVARELAEAGMSTPAIAPILGVGQSTVDRDLRQLTQMRNLNRPAIVTGRDGKQYRFPPPKIEPSPPKIEYVRPVDIKMAEAPEPPPVLPLPLFVRIADLQHELRKLITRLQDLAEDERLPRNKDLAGDFIRARDALQLVIDKRASSRLSDH